MRTVAETRVSKEGREVWRPAGLLGTLFRAYLACPSHPFKIRLENWLGRVVFRQEILLKGHNALLLVDPNDWITRVILKHGNYEEHSLRLAKKLMKDGGYFVDVGANFGLYTCAIGTLPDVTVLAIEPDAASMARLASNLVLNPSVKPVLAQTVLAARYGDPIPENRTTW